jgi:hypothetical protein
LINTIILLEKNSDDFISPYLNGDIHFRSELPDQSADLLFREGLVTSFFYHKAESCMMDFSLVDDCKSGERFVGEANAAPCYIITEHILSSYSVYPFPR